MTVRISVIPGYAAMSRDSLETAMASDKELSALNGQLAELDGDEAGFFEQEHILPVTDRRDNHCLIAIVFAALAVEAYMYDYAARNLGEQFVASHLDRLDVVSKWVIIPRLVTGKGFPKGERAYRLLGQLVAHRNSIVHSKSAPLIVWDEKLSEPIVGRRAERSLEFSRSLIQKAREAIQALDELALAMESLDPNKFTSFVFSAPVGKKQQHLEEYGF